MKYTFIATRTITEQATVEIEADSEEVARYQATQHFDLDSSLKWEPIDSGLRFSTAQVARYDGEPTKAGAETVLARAKAQSEALRRQREAEIAEEQRLAAEQTANEGEPL